MTLTLEKIDMDNLFAIVEPEDVETARFPESGIPHRKLTESLGATKMRVNTVTVPPGTSTASHTHERQEEIYVAIDGGQIELDGTIHDVEPGTVIRIDPSTTRSVRNDGDEPTNWIMFGAPPVGTIENFGEYRLPEE